MPGDAPADIGALTHAIIKFGSTFAVGMQHAALHADALVEPDLGFGAGIAPHDPV